MKHRIKIDSAILSLIILLTAFVCQFHRWYETNRYVDNLMDFLGMMLILNGAYIRMAARGHKKAYSGRGQELVTNGPYALVRNPMYLGTFLLSSGFILILWPWWILPIFAFLFYMRFQRQINKEEEHLNGLFNQGFETYRQEVPPLFPTFEKLRRLKIKETFPWREAWTTKEQYGLFSWPPLALVLEIIQEKIVLGKVDIFDSIFISLLAVVVFSLGLWWEYVRE